MKIKHNIKDKYNQFLILFFLLGNVMVFAQSGQDNVNIPNQIPPTPETFNFAKYGEIPVNESSGNATVDIPLFNFKSGNISVPISISHGGGGVRVDEATTWTGIGWQLNAGGLISRTVNDKQDESTSPTNRVFYSSEALHSFPPNLSEELVFLKSNGVDSEVDIFNYSFGGYSGSFYLDENLQPRQIKYDKELKIELSQDPKINEVTVFNKRTITITTPEGNKYYFGGLNASESTRIKSGAGIFTEFSQTGFYLFKMENPYGDIINFNYNIAGPSGEIIGYSQTLTKDAYVEGRSNCSPSPQIHNYPVNSSYLETSGKVMLANITNNRDNSSIIFNSSYQSSSSLNKFILNSIFIKYNSSQTHRKIVFEYFLPNGSYENRFFLEKVKIFENNNTTTNNIYSFEYNSPEQLPSRFSYSQDYAGFYNGKTNTTYIPKVNDPFFVMPPEIILADRSVVPSKAVFGSLKKVVYPTKGFTEFEYEQALDNSSVEYEKTSRFLNIDNFNPSNPSNPNTPMDSFATLELTEEGPLSILNNNYPVKVNISAEIVGSVTQYHFIKVTLDDLNSTTFDYSQEFNFPNSSNSTIYYNHTFDFTNLNPNGNYVVKLQYYKTGFTSAPISLTATATVVFSSHTPLVKYKPEMRIKRIKNYTDANSQPMITRYYYNKAAIKEIEDSTFLSRIPRFTSESIVQGQCFDNDYCYPYTIHQKNIHSNTQNNIYISDSNKSNYQYVTVSYGGDFFEKGGKESHFFVQDDAPINSLSFNQDYISDQKASNSSLKNGTLMKEIYFSSNPTFNLSTKEITNGKVKEIINNYITLEDKSHEITNCFVSTIHAYPMCVIITNPSLYVSNIYYGHYSTYSWWHTLESTITKEYFGNNIIENRVNYYYDSKLAGLPSRIVENQGSDDYSETINTYPPDVLTIPQMNVLTQQFRISTPVNVKRYRNGNLLSETNTIYNTFSDVVMPQEIQTKKEPNILENRVFYSKYEAGNVLSVSLHGGIPVSYIWGYNKTLPVAKIENFTYNLIPQNLINEVQEASNSGNESSLLGALDNLRSNSALSGALITTYTYKPLIGISTITDAKGNKTTYEYDSFNHLKYVKDNEGNILSEYDFNYRPQN